MLVEQSGKELCELQQSGKRSHSKSKKNRKKSKKPPMVNAIQKLFETCKVVFANGGPGILPSPDDVEKLRSVLDGLKLEDVGLTQDMPYFKKLEIKGTPLITYLHVYECNKFSIGIFCLPASGVIPLHNHPGMTVFSKLLFGSMHIKSYDWVMEASEISKENLKPSENQPAGTRLAMVNTDSVFTAPCKTSILYPAAGGNMHCFTALTSCVVLDVLGPPYSDPEGRECIYYRDVPCANFSGDVANVPVSESENSAHPEEKAEKPKVLACTDEVADVRTNESEKTALLQEKEASEKPLSESPLRSSEVLVCTDDIADVPTTQSEKNILQSSNLLVHTDDIADVPTTQSEENILRSSNVLVCTDDIADVPTTQSEKNILQSCNVLVCTDDKADVPTAQTEKNILLEEQEKSEIPACESAKYAWLEEKEKPANFFVVGALYRGPKVVKN